MFPDFEPTYLVLDRTGETVIVRFKLTHLADDDNIDLLGRELFALVEQYNCRSLVLDMHGVAHVTSSVLGKIITLHRKAHRRGGTVVLCRPGSELAEVLHTTRLAEYFHVADDLDRAVTMARSPSAPG